LIRVDNIARFAVYAVGEVDLQSSVNPVASFFEQRFVHRGRTEVLARISVFDRTAVATDVRIRYQQMAGLTKRKRSQILNGERRNKNLLTSNKK